MTTRSTEARGCVVTRLSIRALLSWRYDVLREAIRDRRDVWLGYVDAQGVRSNLFVTALAVGGGVLEARDRAHDEIRQFTCTASRP